MVFQRPCDRSARVAALVILISPRRFIGRTVLRYTSICCLISPMRSRDTRPEVRPRWKRFADVSEIWTRELFAESSPRFRVAGFRFHFWVHFSDGTSAINRECDGLLIALFGLHAAKAKLNTYLAVGPCHKYVQYHRKTVKSPFSKIAWWLIIVAIGGSSI